MAIDVLGWRGCALQRRWGPTGLRRLQRQHALRRAVARRLPPEQRAEVRLTRIVDGEPVPETWSELEVASHTLERGDPACGRCPLSAGRPVGCWRAVPAPLSELEETALFTSFSTARRESGSVVAALDADVVSRLPRDTVWHQDRGPGGLAVLPAPLFDGERDSAQLLAALFWHPLEHPALVQGMAGFWERFAADVAAGLGGHHGLRVQGGQRAGEEQAPLAALLEIGSLVREAAGQDWVLR